jgi:hypothetical protein
MNDLAEKALHGLDVARRAVISRPMLAFGALGCAVSAVIMVAGAQVNVRRPTRPVSTWLGLQDAHGVPGDDWVPGAIMLGAIALLVLIWIALVESVRRHDQPERRVWSVAAAWALPFVLGPPLMDTTIQSYAAFGSLQRHGLDPYDVGANHLGANRIVAAIEPSFRGTPSSSGPLGTLLQHAALSLSGGSLLGAMLVLRATGVVATVLIGRFATDLAGTRRSRALTLTVLNPLLLLFVVSAGHLDGLMVALVLAALAAAGQRRWLVSIALVCIAGSVEGQAFVVLPAIVAAHWLGRRTIAWWRLIGRDVAVAAGTVVLCALVVPDGFGWLWTVSEQFSAHTPFSVAGAIAKLFKPVVRGASYDDLAAGARITAITAMVCLIGYLIATARQRALERTAGYSLLAIALLAPVLYPWYLLWGALCLAPAATGARRLAVIGLCAAGCLLMPPGFSPTTTNVVTGVALTVVVGVVLTVALRRERALRRAVPVSAGR